MHSTEPIDSTAENDSETTNMPTSGIMKRIAESPPRHNDRLVGAYYLLTILAGVSVIFFHGRLAFAADLIATVVYIGITKLFYALSKKSLARDDRDLTRSVTEPARTITFRRSGRPHPSRASAHHKTSVIRTSTKSRPAGLTQSDSAEFGDEQRVAML